ncbi:hypothetical protein GCM10010398_70170 [Streptomyces fimbriatus]
MVRCLAAGVVRPRVERLPCGTADRGVRRDLPSRPAVRRFRRRVPGDPRVDGPGDEDPVGGGARRTPSRVVEGVLGGAAPGVRADGRADGRRGFPRTPPGVFGHGRA